MNIEIKKVKLSALKLNPDNPRTISKKDMDKLVKSLADFPEMLEIREIVVDETMTVLGGNMRLQALKKAGAKECNAKIVSGLTDEQKREFVIKDNGAWGDWDMDALANTWGDLPLVDWGVKIPESWGSQGLEQQELGVEGEKATSGGAGGEFLPSLIKEPLVINLSATEKVEWDQAKEKAKLVDDKTFLLKLARKFLKEE